MTDSKYLALLGLDGQTSTTPVSLKPQNVTVVSLVRPGNEQYIYGFVRNVSHFLPNNSIVIYSVGLDEDSLQSIRVACNSTRCNVIHFDLSPFPAHVADDTLHVYRPLVIQVSKSNYLVISWLFVVYIVYILTIRDIIVSTVDSFKYAR